jgi:uncharacterized protein (TIGR00369 family)
MMPKSGNRFSDEIMPETKMASSVPTGVPFLDHCGIERLYRKDGVCRGAVDVIPERTNPTGAAHGGLLMTLLDAMLAGACISALPETKMVATIDMQVAFLIPGRGRLEAEGRLLRGTKALMFAEGEVRNGAGEIVARASGQFWILDRERVKAKAKD